MILPPKQSYLICTSPRSGSTLLCNLLTQAGAGKPNSFFRVKSIEDWAHWWGLPPTTPQTYGTAYIDAAIRSGEYGTGIFGMRTMWDSMKPLLARLAANSGPRDDLAQLTAYFGPMKFIQLSRADRVAQAVSLAIAEQTGLWHRHADGSVMESTKALQTPVYNSNAIAHELAGLETEAAGWAAWFDQTNIAPYRIRYEDLAADPKGTLARVLVHIGLEPHAAQSIRPGTAKLADQINRDWVKRFRAEAGLPPQSQRA